MARSPQSRSGATGSTLRSSVSRASRKAGLFDYSPEDTEIKRIYMEQAKRVVVLCDAQKFGHHSMVQVGSLGAVHTLVTDVLPPPSLAAALRSAGVDVRKT